MKRNKASRIPLLVALNLCCAAIAQESPTPTPTPAETASPAVTPMPTTSPEREVRLHFVPPPMEGTISLGIFDDQGKLVRVLHREAKIDNFTVEADSLSTTWDGKNDAGEDAPPGKYRARGYGVGEWKVDQLEQADSNPGTEHVSVKLVENPLVRGTRPTADLALGSDAAGTFLKTTDGLPLFTVNKTPNAAAMSIGRSGKRTVDVWQSDGASVTQFRVSNVDQMMAFDCGTFELK
jgi:hypothetical protein